MTTPLGLKSIMLLGGMLLVGAACDLARGQPTPNAPRENPSPAETVASTEAATPTRTPLVVAPLAESPVQCPNTLPTRIIVNERGRVLDDDPRAINVREGPGIDFRVLGRIEVNGVFYVLDGPECADNYTWYRVRYRLVEGWIAEGDATSYYVEPFMPG